MPREALLIFFGLILQSSAKPQEFFNTTPQPIKSNFTCVGRLTGYYADVPSNCRVYHNCDDQGNKFSYYCPEMTAFRQEALICDHAHLVDCQAGTRIGKKTPQSASRTLIQSNYSTETQNADSSTPANPFRNFFTPKNSSANYFGFYSPNASQSGLDSEADKKFSTQARNPFSRLEENSRNDDGHSLSNNNGTRFFATILERPVPKTRENFTQVKTSEDRLKVNTRGLPVWNNIRENFPGHPEVNVERNLGAGRVKEREESTTPDFQFGHHMLHTTMSYFNSRKSNYPKPDVLIAETPGGLTSQRTSSTSEIPLRDFTASLKPLVPNTLEYDPYYPPESSTTTEIYYTPSGREKLPPALEAPNFEPSRFGVYFKVPDQWPDFNTLDDIIDRRKLFYIPRNNQKL